MQLSHLCFPKDGLPRFLSFLGLLLCLLTPLEAQECLIILVHFNTIACKSEPSLQVRQLAALSPSSVPAPQV